MWMEISEGFLNPSGALGNVPWTDVWVTIGKKRKGSMFRGRGRERIGLFILSLSVSLSPWGWDRSDDYFSCLQGILQEIHKWGWLCPFESPWCITRGPREEVIGKQSSQGAKGWDERHGKGSVMPLTAPVRETTMFPGCPGAPKWQRGQITPAWLWPWSQQKQRLMLKTWWK